MSIKDWLIWIRLAMEIMKLIDKFFDDDKKKDVFIAQAADIFSKSGVMERAASKA